MVNRGLARPLLERPQAGVGSDRLLRLPDALEVVGMSRSAWYEAMKRADAPKPYRLSGSKSVAWKQSELQAFIASRPRAHEAASAA